MKWIIWLFVIIIIFPPLEAVDYCVNDYTNNSDGNDLSVVCKDENFNYTQHQEYIEQQKEEIEIKREQDINPFIAITIGFVVLVIFIVLMVIITDARESVF